MLPMYFFVRLVPSRSVITKWNMPPFQQTSFSRSKSIARFRLSVYVKPCSRPPTGLPAMFEKYWNVIFTPLCSSCVRKPPQSPVAFSSLIHLCRSWPWTAGARRTAKTATARFVEPPRSRGPLLRLMPSRIMTGIQSGRARKRARLYAQAHANRPFEPRPRAPRPRHGGSHDLFSLRVQFRLLGPGGARVQRPRKVRLARPDDG